MFPPHVSVFFNYLIMFFLFLASYVCLRLKFNANYKETEKRMKTNNRRNFSFNFPRQWLGFFLQKQSMISRKISFTRMDNVVSKSDLSSTRNLSQMRHFNYTQWDLMRLFIIEFPQFLLFNLPYKCPKN